MTEEFFNNHPYANIGNVAIGDEVEVTWRRSKYLGLRGTLVGFVPNQGLALVELPRASIAPCDCFKGPVGEGATKPHEDLLPIAIGWIRKV